MNKSVDRILTTHTGSLPRPAALVDLLASGETGQGPNASQFEQLAADATIEIVRQQIANGIDLVNDGEMSKIGYSTYVKDRLTGFDGEGEFFRSSDTDAFPGFAARFASRYRARRLTTPACDRPVQWKDREAVSRDIARLKTALGNKPVADAFMTAASPGVIALFLENKYYPTHEEYVMTLADVMSEEYEAIHRAGFMLQLDCPDLAAGRHTRFSKSRTAEFLKVVEMHVAAINRALTNIPSEKVRIHLCWGNYEGPHHHDIPLRDIIGEVLKARVGAISIEAANPRHAHEWVVFKDVKLPLGMKVIPGVLDSCTNYIEHPELVAQRIVRFAELVGRENVIAGSDCGFSTFAGRSDQLTVDPEITWAKFRAMSEGARIATRELW